MSVYLTARVPGCGCLAHFRQYRACIFSRQTIETWTLGEGLILSLEEMNIRNQNIACANQEACPKSIPWEDRILTIQTSDTYNALRVMAALERASE